MESYIETLKKYAVFEGRATRKEYWVFVGINFLIGMVLGFVEGMLGIDADSSTSILGSIFNLVVLLPSIGVAIRRMHDVGKSGWFILIPIYNLILALTQGETGSNKYGEDPRK